MIILISLGILLAIFIAGSIGDLIDRGLESVPAKLYFKIVDRVSHSNKRKNKRT